VNSDVGNIAGSSPSEEDAISTEIGNILDSQKHDLGRDNHLEDGAESGLSASAYIRHELPNEGKSVIGRTNFP